MKRRRLVNVRLDPERVRKAYMLREHGVSLSDVMRDAIDARFDELQQSTSGRNARAIVQHILEAHPDPPGLPPRDYDVHDRRAAGAAIVRKLRARRP